MEYHLGIQSHGTFLVEEPEIMHEHDPFATKDSYLVTEFASLNHSECVKMMRERVIEGGYPIVDRSIVKLKKQIKKGGQGTVYEASVSWPLTDKATIMAVKKFDPTLGILQGLYPVELWTVGHLNVLMPSAFFFDDDSTLCMMMPKYLGDLRDAIDARMRDSSCEGGASGAPFEVFVAFIIIFQIALGMKGMHEVGICHRDLKAANILMINSFMCHIADFETSEHVVGTAFWRAPEVLSSLRTGIKLTKDQWPAADVYSFGMTCYEVLTGEVPFHGHLFCDYDIVLGGSRPELPSHIPQILKDIIQSCWHPERDSRPAFGEIVEALRSYDQEPFCKSVESYETTLDSLVKIPIMLTQSQGLESPQSDMLRLNELVLKHSDVDNEAKAGHRNYAFCAHKFVATNELFVLEFGWNSYQARASLPFALYLRRRKLATLITQQHSGFSINVGVRLGTLRSSRDIDYGHLHVLEMLEMMVLAKNVLVEIMRGSHHSRFEDNDNDLTMKEKLKLLEAYVIDINDVLMEGLAMELIQDIVERMDPDGTDSEIAEFHLHMKFYICHQTFLNNYGSHVRLVI